MSPETGDELKAYTFNLPRCHLEAMRQEANELSGPQKQVKTAEVARFIIAQWYENRRQQTSRA